MPYAAPAARTAGHPCGPPVRRRLRIDSNPHIARLRKHSEVSSYLAGLDDETLAGLLQRSSAGKDGFGGRTTQLAFGKLRIFCKLIPLTILEAQPENYKSTANLFRLPSYYQYGIGSVGFGAWRELAAHALASDWVASGKQEQFPLLHHWRIVKLPGVASVESEADDYLTHAAAHGNDESAIRERLVSLRASASHIAIFSEYFPKTLSDWLVEELQKDTQSASTAIWFTEERARAVLDFMRRANFVHFDAHLSNILTDGNRLYFADFGLALHDSFELTHDERSFLSNHSEYDKVRFAASMVHTICRAMPGEEGWSQKLSNADLQAKSLPLAATAALQRYAVAAKYMGQFAQALINTNRHAAFAPPPEALR
ncbi:hypothetical protein DFR39_102446 [Roseateles asaccharophilus]|uniref:Protein kinase domain-containing protein n=1 Tax=Roseateles asaccharophilus TaxID=582607 RepID=A0A4R6N9H6_9BURK|nr:hypothetical protein DFR39_102446 [Roseateles asaccharophilus]